MRYENEICQGCGKVMEENDDVVVCPECGTPQHRECWKAENKCVNEHLHSEDFEWKPKHSHVVQTEEIKKPAGEMKTCIFCGHDNPEDAEKCENCDQPFKIFGVNIMADTRKKREDREDYAFKPPFTVNRGRPEMKFSENGELDYADDVYIPDDDEFLFNGEAFSSEILGCETKDFVSYIRNNVSKYYKKFKKHENKENTFNGAALIFGGFWFMFRKMYRQGVIFLTIFLCLNIAMSGPVSEFAEEIYPVQQEYFSLAETAESMTEDELEQAIEELTESVEKVVIKYAKWFALYVAVIAANNIVAACIADMLYRKKFLRDMKTIAETDESIDPTAKYMNTLKLGGTTVAAPFIAYFALQIISYIAAGVFR